MSKDDDKKRKVFAKTFGFPMDTGGYYDGGVGEWDDHYLGEDEEEPKNTVNIPQPKEIKEYLDRFVIGQEYAKKTVSTLIVNHLYRAEYNQTALKSTDKLKKSNILLIGDSGVGKTLCVKVAAEYVDVPIVVEDATKLTQEGYVGDSVDTLLTRLILEAGGDVDKAEKGIIFLDEFDKLSSNSSDRSNVATGAVQQSLLKMVEGGDFYVPDRLGERQGTNKVAINTDSITFIFAGAFGGLASEVKKDVSMGFLESSREREILEQDIIDYGIMPEILGRIGTYITLHELSEDDMLKILMDVENSIVKQYQKIFELRGIKWKLNKRHYKKIIKECKESKLGARGLQRHIEQLLLEDMYNEEA